MKQVKTESKVLDKAELEMLEILKEADIVKGEQLNIGLDSQVKVVKEVQNIDFENIDDPQLKYDLYYNGIQRILRNKLPKGATFKEARNYIYEQKNIFITRGNLKNKSGKRGADGRMAFITDLEIILDIIIKWVNENGSMVTLYNTLLEENKKRGYRTS